MMGHPMVKLSQSLLNEIRIAVESGGRGLDSFGVLPEAVSAEAKFEAINTLRDIIHDLSPNVAQPVDRVRWVPIERVQANDYNPNSVAVKEMTLLLRSIDHDGYTQPIVAIWDETVRAVCERCTSHAGVRVPTCCVCAGTGIVEGRYVVVDGFHRYYVSRTYPQIRERCHGFLPVVVLEKDINDRMASTVRHNRARGKHSVDGMANMVFAMLENGMEDAAICNELGMEAEELVRLKHITGFAKLFEDVKYNRAWVTKAQARLKRAREAAGEAVSPVAVDTPK